MSQHIKESAQFWLHALLVKAYILGAICPNLLSFAILQMVFPVTHIFSTIRIMVSTFAIGLVILPLAFVEVAVHMPELTLTIGHVLTPFTLILVAVGPYLDAWTFSYFAF